MTERVRRTVRLDPERNERLKQMAEDLSGYGDCVSVEELLMLNRGLLVELYSMYQRDRDHPATDPESSVSDFLLWIESRMNPTIPEPRPGQPHAS
jgi:hypothetical protein